MISSLARRLVRSARLVLVLSVLATVIAGVLGFTVLSNLGTQGYDNPASDSAQATKLVDQDFGGSPDLVFLIHARGGDVDRPDAVSSGEALTQKLRTNPSLTSVTSYFGTRAPTLRSSDGADALILAQLTGTEQTRDTQAATVLDEYNDSSDGVTSVLVGGPAGIDLGRQTTADVVLAESIAIPVVLILLVLVFGSAVAALLPMVVALISIVGSFAILNGLTQFTDVSIFAINLVTALGLGLGVDYALLFVSRYREELRAGATPREGVVNTLMTAGRTIAFSAITVLAALSAMLVFPPYFLKSFAYAGIAVVAVAALAALVVLPALLVVLGERVNSGKLPWLGKERAEGASRWGRMTQGVMRRPLVVLLPTLVLLGLLATPWLGIQSGSPDDRVLPAAAPAHRVGDSLRSGFDSDASSSLDLVITHVSSSADIQALAANVSRIEGIGRVDAAAGSWEHGGAVGAAAGAQRFAAADNQRMVASLTVDPTSGAAEKIVDQVRALPAPPGGEILVGGPTAALMDNGSHHGQSSARHTHHRRCHDDPAVPVHRKHRASVAGGAGQCRDPRCHLRCDGVDVPGRSPLLGLRIHPEPDELLDVGSQRVRGVRAEHGLRSLPARSDQGSSRPGSDVRSRRRDGRVEDWTNHHLVRCVACRELLRVCNRQCQLHPAVRPGHRLGDPHRRDDRANRAGACRHEAARRAVLVRAPGVAPNSCQGWHQ